MPLIRVTISLNCVHAYDECMWQPRQSIKIRCCSLVVISFEFLTLSRTSCTSGEIADSGSTVSNMVIGCNSQKMALGYTDTVLVATLLILKDILELSV